MAILEATIVGDHELVLKLRKMPDSVREKLRDAIRKAQRDLQNTVKSEYLSGQVLQVRSGALRRSIAIEPLVETPSSIQGSIGTNAKQARIQEKGGLVQMHDKYLTLPLDAVLTGSGFPRYSAKQIIDNPSIGGFVRTLFRGGFLFGVHAGSKGPRGTPERLTPLFKLKESVRLPARPYLSVALKAKQSQISRQLETALSSAMKDLTGA